MRTKKSKIEMLKIYCPDCGRLAMTIDNRCKSNQYVKCKKCKKMVVYHGMTNKITLEPILPRSCSSGMRFY